MPVIFVSYDSENKKLRELDDLIDKFDYVYLEQDQRADNLYDIISDRITCDHSFYITDLNNDEYAAEKMANLFRLFSDVKTGNILIISHQSFFQAVGQEVAEWQPVSFQCF